MCVRARARRSPSRRDSTPAAARRRSTHSISATFFTPSIPTRVVCSFAVASAPLALPPRLDSCDGADGAAAALARLRGGLRGRLRLRRQADPAREDARVRQGQDRHPRAGLRRVMSSQCHLFSRARTTAPPSHLTASCLGGGGVVARRVRARALSLSSLHPAHGGGERRRAFSFSPPPSSRDGAFSGDGGGVLFS